MSSCFVKITPSVYFFSYDQDDPFLANFLSEFTEAIAGRYKLIIKNGDNFQPFQLIQINNALDQGDASAFIISMIDPLVANLPIAAAQKKSMPVIFFNREPPAEYFHLVDNTYYVGLDEKQGGKLQGELIAEYWKGHPEADLNRDGKIQYLLLRGGPTGTSGNMRTVALFQALDAAHVQYSSVAEARLDWSRNSARQYIANLYMKSPPPIECVISNNDEMALGAIDIFKKLGYFKGDKFLPVFGYDGIPAAIDALREQSLSATVYNDVTNQSEAIIELLNLVVDNDNDLSKVHYRSKDRYSFLIPPVKIRP